MLMLRTLVTLVLLAGMLPLAQRDGVPGACCQTPAGGGAHACCAMPAAPDDADDQPEAPPCDHDTRITTSCACTTQSDAGLLALNPQREQLPALVPTTATKLFPTAPARRLLRSRGPPDRAPPIRRLWLENAQLLI